MLVGARRSLLRRVSAVVSVSAEVDQFLARATGMNGTHVTAFTNLIDGLVADGVWPLLDALWITATDTEAHAKMNLKSSSYTITETGTVPWAADIGYSPGTGDTSNYLLSGFNPSTAGGQFSQNSCHISAWLADLVNTNGGMIGARDTGAGREVNLYAITGGIAVFRPSGASFGGITAANASSPAHYIATRTSSSAIVGYKNGVSFATGSEASVALINKDLALGGLNGAVPTSEDGDYSAFSIGAGLNGTQAAALYNRIAAYRTAVGL